MATNKLLEAAADILAGSKKSASAMPTAKLPGTEMDLGGPTTTNSKPMDDSNKIDATKGAKSATAPTTKPSAASSDTQNHPQGGTKTMKEDEEYDEELEEFEEAYDSLTLRSLNSPGAPTRKGGTGTYSGNTKPRKKTVDAATERLKTDIKDSLGKHPKPNLPEEYEGEEYSLVEELRVQMREDIQSMFADDDTISEDFKIKAATIFEARVFDRVAQIEEEVEVRYASMFEEAVEEIKNDLTTKVNDYLEYVVEQWLADNEIAIESGLRSEITEEFIAGLRNLFAEHYIDVPEDKVDLVDELAGQVEQLEDKLNEEMQYGIELRKALIESTKNEIVRNVCDGLAATQVEKIKSLAESVEFSTEEEYTEKLETIRENYFPSGIKKADVTHLQEQYEDADNEKKVIHDPYVAMVSQAISKTKI